MKRRAFMQLLGAATLVWPRAGVAQQSNSPQRASGVAGGSFQWTRMPSTALRPVLPTKAQLGAAWGVVGPLGLIGDWTTAWLKEVRMARGDGTESVVLFALDQFCLIGYACSLPMSARRSVFLG